MPRCREEETIAEAVQHFSPATSLSDLDNWRAALSHRGIPESALGTPGCVYVTNRDRGEIVSVR
jgi:hypothetical protein